MTYPNKDLEDSPRKTREWGYSVASRNRHQHSARVTIWKTSLPTKTALTHPNSNISPHFPLSPNIQPSLPISATSNDQQFHTPPLFHTSPTSIQTIITATMPMNWGPEADARVSPPSHTDEVSHPNQPSTAFRRRPKGPRHKGQLRCSRRRNGTRYIASPHSHNPTPSKTNTMNRMHSQSHYPPHRKDQV